MTSLGEDGLLKGASPAAQTNAAKLKWKEDSLTRAAASVCVPASSLNIFGI